MKKKHTLIVVFILAFLLIIPIAISGDNNGSAVCNAGRDQLSVHMCCDSSGNTYITWLDNRSSNYDVYVQKLNSDGIPQWTSNGVAVCTESSGQTELRICCDGENGVIIAWVDDRNSDNDIFAQKINSEGISQWTLNGAPVCTWSGNQDKIQICSDGSGGVIVVWRNQSSDIFAQKLDSNGDIVWGADAVPVCTYDDSVANPRICSDGNGGAIIAWEDYRDPVWFYIYAQKLSLYGIPQWTLNGTVLCNNNKDQLNPKICSDGNGGAIISWQ